VIALAAMGGALVVLLPAWHRRPGPSRVRALRPIRDPRRRPNPAATRLAVTAAVTAGSALVLPIAAPVLGVAAWAVPVLRQRRRRGGGAEAVRRSLPETIDLLRLAVGSGLNVPLAVGAVAEHGHGPAADALAWVAEQVRGGRRCADALDAAAARLGPPGRPLFAALAASDRYGAPLVDPLARLAADARLDRRRRAEEVARRIPVQLLFPLVVCVLPAFALLTVAPLIAGGLGSLRL
jgi:tight adherence protein C